MKIILLMVLLMLPSYGSTAVTFDKVTVDKVSIPTALPIMAIGDSITVGISGTPANGGYRSALYTALSNNYRFYGSVFTPTDHNFGKHEGVSSQTTTQIEARITTNIVEYPVNIGSGAVALIHAGTNDMDACDPGCTSEIVVAVDNVEDMIDIIIAHDSSIAIYVALIIPSTTAQLETEIVLYNTALSARIASLQGSNPSWELYEVDMHSAFNNVANCATVGACMADALRPNDAGYTVMSDTWATEILANE